MAQSEEFKHESVQDRASIGRYLRALIEGFEAGRLELGASEQTLVLATSGLIELEIKAKHKSGRSRVALRFSWREERSREEPKPAAPLTIRTQ